MPNGRYLLALTLLLAATVGHVAWAADEGKPAVLFVNFQMQDFHLTYLKQFLREMQAAGYEVDYTTFEQLDMAQFSKFNVIVYLNVPNWDGVTHEATEAFKAQAAALRKHLAAGGGLLVTSHPGAHRLPVLWHLLKPLGLTVEVATIHDPQARHATLVGAPFSFTDNFMRHPVTEGVRGLWFAVYPPGGDVWNANTLPFTVDATWQVLVRSNDTTYTAAYTFSMNEVDKFKPAGEVRGDVPLLAVKDLNPGRVAFCGMDPSYHVWGGRAPAWEGVTMGTGLGGKPSDSERLMLNLLDWLGEPSLKSGALGGAKTDPEKIKRPELTPPPPKTSWEFWEPEKRFHGVIGARSHYSTGNSSLKEYADAARRAGFSFVFFTEDLQRISEQNFGKLQAECKALSADDLLLCAGLDCEDETGNHYVIFNPGLKWPAASLLLKDKRVFWVLSEQPRGLAFCNYAQQNYPALIGFYRDESGVPWWDTRCYRQCLPLYTYVNGRKVDELTVEYLELADAGEWPVPIVLNFVDSGEQLAAVRTQNQPHTVLLGQTLSQWAKEQAPAPDFRPTAWVTNGPEIEYWQWSSDRDYVANGNWFDWTRYRWRLRLKVTSAVGLKEIRIMDGPGLFRRYLPGGAKSYERTIELTHNQQHNLVLIVEDTAGGRAYGGELLDRSHLMEIVYCGDRMNTLSYACLPSDGPFGSTVGTWPLPTMPKGPLTDNLFNELNLDMYRFPGYDGQPGGHIAISPVPYVFSVDGSEGGLYNRRILRPLGSADVAIQETTFEHSFAPGVKVWNSWHNLGPLVPTKLLKGRLRYTTFVHPGHLPAPTLVEGELEMRRDGRFDDKRLLPLHAAFAGSPWASAGYNHVSIRHTGDHDLDFNINHEGKPQVERWSGKFPAGAYGYFYPSIFGPGGLFSLMDDMAFEYVGPPLFRVNIGFDLRGKPFKAGDRIRFSYLAFTGGYDALPSNLLAEQFRDLMGLDGSPGYSLTCEQGQPVSQVYLCRVDGQGHGFAGAIAAEKGLPCILPLAVENANPRWSAVLYERDAKRYRPLAVQEGKAYAHVDLTAAKPKPQKLFVGHPFTCDNPAVFLALVQVGERELLLAAHNPTDAAVRITARRSQFFDFVTDDNFALDIPAGDTRLVELPRMTP